MTLKKEKKLYIYIYIYKHEKIQSYKKQNKIKKKKKMENGCASKVLAVGSSIGLSRLLFSWVWLQVSVASEVEDLL